ncbi:MAG: DUF262 domain-containing protein [Flavobacteriaceae bacterium]|nr:DUF262 domain-containing protein [Flavobacteriaceae bacterium]
MISNLITQIDNKEIVLPAIQRNFVWNENRITMMFDSIMRGYPLGIVLLWETYLDIKYREFNDDYNSESKYSFKDNDTSKRLKLVLDGQQRLQSLFIAINGRLDNKVLFVDLLSGKKADDFREVFYIFRFLHISKAKEIKKKTIENRNNNKEEDNNEEEKIPIYVSVKEILSSSPESRLTLKNKIKKEYKLTDEEVLRFELNMNKLIHSITNDPNVLKVSTIDENKPKDSQDRKTESDILEAFVRINRQGITLSRSDLIFSMLKLNWKESSEELPDFIKEINEGNNLGIDIDFVIRTLFTVSNLGSKFDVNLLRKQSNIVKVKANYERTCNAIRSLVDFMEDECNILNSNIIGGYLNLIPIVYYLANTPDNLVPNSEINRLKKALYIFSFTKPFSRYGDSRIGKFVREEIKPLIDKKDYTFPLEDSIGWANSWENYNSFDIKLLQRNRHLTLHLLQGKQGTKVKYSRNSPELDHIFPKSKLKEKGYERGEINAFGNFWILAKTKNQNKSNKHPKKYFADVDDSILKKSLIDREMFDYRKYKSFVKWRENEILTKIKKLLGVKDNEIDFDTIWTEDE